MVILDTLGLVTCQVSVTPAWSCSSQNPRGSELAELGDTESNPHTGKLSQREDGACPESQSLFPYPFSYVQRGSFLESGLTTGWISPLPTQEHHTLSHPSRPLREPPPLCSHPRSLLEGPFSFAVQYLGHSTGGKEHTAEWGWEPGSSLHLHPAPSCPCNPGLTEKEAGLWTSPQ